MYPVLIWAIDTMLDRVVADSFHRSPSRTVWPLWISSGSCLAQVGRMAGDAAVAERWTVHAASSWTSHGRGILVGAGE